MIKNNRQLEVARKRHSEAQVAARGTDGLEAKVYAALAEETAAEIAEYESVTAGYARTFKLESLDDLAEALIKARLARRWTQRQLADAMGVKEQSVQRDEAGGYERAGLARCADVVDALGYRMIGCLEPQEEQPLAEFRGWKITFVAPELHPPLSAGTASVYSTGTAARMTVG